MMHQVDGDASFRDTRQNRSIGALSRTALDALIFALSMSLIAGCGGQTKTPRSLPKRPVKPQSHVAKPQPKPAPTKNEGPTLPDKDKQDRPAPAPSVPQFDILDPTPVDLSNAKRPIIRDVLHNWTIQALEVLNGSTPAAKRQRSQLLAAVEAERKRLDLRRSTGKKLYVVATQVSYREKPSTTSRPFGKLKFSEPLQILDTKPRLQDLKPGQAVEWFFIARARNNCKTRKGHDCVGWVKARIHRAGIKYILVTPLNVTRTDFEKQLAKCQRIGDEYCQDEYRKRLTALGKHNSVLAMSRACHGSLAGAAAWCAVGLAVGTVAGNAVGRGFAAGLFGVLTGTTTVAALRDKRFPTAEELITDAVVDRVIDAALKVTPLGYLMQMLACVARSRSGC